MKKLIFPLLFSSAFLFSSCDELSDILGESGDSLTEAQVVSGLKSALEVGTNSAVSYLGVQDGYYGNDLYKILLPDEASVIVENIGKIPGGELLLNNVILGINRAAEDAAKEAGPIFVESITSMSIADGWTILNGDNHAATTYLKNTTNSQLVDLYAPKINASLGKDLLGSGITVANTWSQLTSAWNSFVNINNVLPLTTKYNPVSTDLGAYLTQKALDGMYLKISVEEEKIREDPLARVNDILQKVFGSLDK
ncbi:uncharacterized protein DUF4197 [Breznakibacter xylanolyticus]|uniref:Uncharacterized protein DUF4197 n=1 Tax=Breznakibacter xylanolyticus TaxID=990 RepID=A0A2W7NJ52_9BACT|nr:DUF4197 domain-containing protein [Breznakibacter xylanolyticus]PZX20278.1 uncharacterized protein DUF4197 [Breznakibacter xylanolyticus]